MEQNVLFECPNLPNSNGVKFSIIGGSVLDFVGDAFVNAANEGCVTGFGVDEWVNRSGGFQLKEARRKLGGCPTGSAKLTPSFDHTNTKYIIHAVGPVYRRKKNLFIVPNSTSILSGDTSKNNKNDNEDETQASQFVELDQKLYSAYAESIRIAEQNDEITTLAFCCLSAGVFLGEKSLEDVLHIAVKGIAMACQSTSSLKSVQIYAFTEAEQNILPKVAHNYFHNSVET